MAEGWTAIPLRRSDGTVRAYALVDNEDAERIGASCWHLNGGYARHSIYRPGQNPGVIAMHHAVLGRDAGGLDVDHINRDKLDNRRANLRIVDRSTNMFNVGKRSDAKHSKYRGVGLLPDGRWYAEARFRGRRKRVYCESEIEAARVVEEIREELVPHG